MALPVQPRGSNVMLDEYFSIQDDRFLDELRNVSDSVKLAGLAERWKKDPRPWARKQILAYLALPLNCEGHHPLVKRLFKHAEAQRDHEQMVAFTVAFDRLVRRVTRTRHTWDFETRQTTEIEHLFSPRNSLYALKRSRNASNPNTGQRIVVPFRKRRGFLFSYHTRGYLRRRAWRYFRWMGFQNPNQYIQSAAAILKRYTDADFASEVNILDSRSMLCICYGAHDALIFQPSHAALQENRALGELTAKPPFEALWSKPEAMNVLLSIVCDANAGLMRLWATQLLRAKHAEALRALATDDILKLLEHPDDQVQQFGADVLNSLSRLDKLAVATWLKLLRTRNLTALQTICDAFLKHVQSERLTLEQCVELACEQAASIAKLGASYLRMRSIKTAEERRTIAALANAKSAAMGLELAAFSLPILGAKDGYDRDAVCCFFDSLLKEMRSAAWTWLLKKEGPAYDDAGLWSRLIETPYDDIRLPMVDLLAVRALPGTNADALELLWCTVLLSIHRGGRQKSKAVRQIGDAIRDHPSRAARLLPVLAVAIRSIRPAEARAGITSLVGALERCPELADTIQKHLPELRLSPAASEASK